MHVSSAIQQYVALNIWSEEGFRQMRSPSSTYFGPPWVPSWNIWPTPQPEW